MSHARRFDHVPIQNRVAASGSGRLPEELERARSRWLRGHLIRSSSPCQLGLSWSSRPSPRQLTNRAPRLNQDLDMPGAVLFGAN
jgi:hypothetical protein